MMSIWVVILAIPEEGSVLTKAQSWYSDTQEEAEEFARSIAGGPGYVSIHEASPIIPEELL